MPLEPPEIVVTGERLFGVIRPERDLDERAISSFGVSTIDELVAEVQDDSDPDEEPPVILVNGERVHDLDDIGAYPVEVLRRLQLLPRGSATRYGGKSGQRVISLSLARQTRSATVTIAPRFATDGGGHSRSGETIFTHIRGQTRANIALRLRDEDSLFESERGIIQPQPRQPFASVGNLVAFPHTGAEIDPLLSDAAGQVVRVAPIPLGANPSLLDFVARANEAAVTDLGDFRTLRPQSRTYELNGSFATRFASWLSSSATVRLSRRKNHSHRGLASGLFTLSPDNAFSPFSTIVGLALYRDDNVLRYRSARDSGEGNLTLNADVGRWRASFNGRHLRSEDLARSDRQDQFGNIALANDLNPFGGALGDSIGIRTDETLSRSRSSRAQLTLTGPSLKLPAGDVTTTVEGRLEWSRLRSRSSFSEVDEDRVFTRSQRALRGAVVVPIASRRNDVFAAVGDLSATAEAARINVSDAGTLSTESLALIWEPRPPVRLRGAYESSTTPVDIERLGSPVLVTPDARIFDVLTGETVDVLQTTGGNPLLEPERKRTWRTSAVVRLVPSLGLQLNGEYVDTSQRNFVSFLSPTSTAVLLAFPDRFVRDADGVLTSVDLRPVNFAAQRQRRVRYGIGLNAPLGGGGPRPTTTVTAADTGEDPADETPPPAVRGGPRTRVLLTANHTLVLSDEIEIRSGIEPIDLLKGGAIGIGGGRVRHQLDATAGISSGASGARLTASWRGISLLQTRIDGETSELRFSPLLLVNLRAFTDLPRLLPQSSWAEGTRVSLTVVNLANQRQRVRDGFGETPLQYQPGYRDPIGRTAEFEIRKVF